jgi:hypothetical protein
VGQTRKSPAVQERLCSLFEQKFGLFLGCANGGRLEPSKCNVSASIKTVTPRSQIGGSEHGRGATGISELGGSPQ